MTNSFKTHLFRDGEEIPVTVEYTAQKDELYVDRVLAQPTGKEIITTVQEDVALTDEAHEDFVKHRIYSR